MLSRGTMTVPAVGRGAIPRRCSVAARHVRPLLAASTPRTHNLEARHTIQERSSAAREAPETSSEGGPAPNVERPPPPSPVPRRSDSHVPPSTPPSGEWPPVPAGSTCRLDPWARHAAPPRNRPVRIPARNRLTSEQRYSRLAALNLNHKILNSRILRARSLDGLRGLVNKYGPLMNAVNTVTAISRATLRARDSEGHIHRRRQLLRLLEAQWLTHRAEWDDRGVVSAAYSFAKCRYRPCRRVTESVADYVLEPQADGRPRLERFGPQALALLLWATAALDEASSGPVFLAAAESLLSRPDLDSRWNCQALSLTAVSFARSGHFAAHTRVLPRLSQAMQASPCALPAGCNAEQLANFCWAAGVAGCADSGLLRQVSAQVQALVPREGPLDTANFASHAMAKIMWAVASLGFSDPQLMETLCTAMKHGDFLEQCTPESLTRIVWACAKLDVHDEELFQRAADLALAKRGDFLDGDLLQLLWAFQHNDACKPRLLDMVMSELYA